LPVALPHPRLQQDPGVEVWQIGNEGGFLAAPVNHTVVSGNRLLMGRPNAPTSSSISRTCRSATGRSQRGPDEPFGGGVPGVDFPVADAATTAR